MKITELSIWEELGGLQGWSELAASCDASPFAWPSFCLPWWWELGWGRLASVVVEDSGLLVGLALIHDRVGDVGRHMLRFVGDEVGTYHQLLVAEDRDDVCEILLERILSSGREIDFSSIPLELAHSYQSATSCPLVLTEQTTFGFVSVPVESTEPVSTDRIGPVRNVTDPAECLALITGPTEADRWGGGAPGSKMAAFFASAVDASVRAGRMTLHIADRHDGPTSGLLMVHGSRTSVVWRHVGGLPLQHRCAGSGGDRGGIRTWVAKDSLAGELTRLGTAVSPRGPKDGAHRGSVSCDSRTRPRCCPRHPRLPVRLNSIASYPVDAPAVRSC